MTWAEFKRRVEEAGVCDSDRLAYVDVNILDENSFLRDDETQGDGLLRVGRLEQEGGVRLAIWGSI